MASSGCNWQLSPRIEEANIPARVVVVHDEPSFLDPLVTSWQAAGHDVAAFADPGLAWDAMKFSTDVEILVTRVEFEPGKQARSNSPNARILFVALPEFEADLEYLGVLLPRPVRVAEVLEAVG
jgi:hypothetical protein